MSWFLEVPSGEIIFKNSKIQDCIASGGASFVAYTALGNEDFGGNEGIDFESKAYWVENVDDVWENNENWAYVSGGQTKLESPPDSEYDVYFDNNSASGDFYVTLSGEEFQFECKSLYCDTTNIFTMYISTFLNICGDKIQLNENTRFNYDSLSYNDVITFSPVFGFKIYENVCSLRSSGVLLPPIIVYPYGE